MRLREIRKAKGLTVPKLAEMAGMSRRTIEDIERNDECKVSTALKLAETLCVTMDELCARNEEKQEV